MHRPLFSKWDGFPPLISESLSIRNCDIHEHYTRCRNDPRAVARNSHIMKKSFICKGPELWGALPKNTKERKSLSSVKRQIKNINAYTNWIRFLSWSYHNIWSGWGGCLCMTFILLFLHLLILTIMYIIVEWVTQWGGYLFFFWAFTNLNSFYYLN